MRLEALCGGAPGVENGLRIKKADTFIHRRAENQICSRTIEAASYSDVAVCYLCANHHPDHDSICAFRAANKQAFEAAVAKKRSQRNLRPASALAKLFFRSHTLLRISPSQMAPAI
jgi:hypothetical protein